MKVVFVLPQWWLRPVGGYAVVFGHADGLVRRGHEAHVLIGRPPPGALADELARRERVGAPLVDWRPTDPRVRFHVVEQVDDDAAPDADVVVATATSTVAPVIALAAVKVRKHQLVQGHETWMSTPEDLARTWAPRPANSWSRAGSWRWRAATA